MNLRYYRSHFSDKKLWCSERLLCPRFYSWEGNQGLSISKNPCCSNCVKPRFYGWTFMFICFLFVCFFQKSLFIEMTILMHKSLSSELMIFLEETTISEFTVTEYIIIAKYCQECLYSHQPGYSISSAFSMIIEERLC